MSKKKKEVRMVVRPNHEQYIDLIDGDDNIVATIELIDGSPVGEIDGIFKLSLPGKPEEMTIRADITSGLGADYGLYDYVKWEIESKPPTKD